MTDDKAFDLSIVVPCFNEGENVPALVERYREIRQDDVKTQLVLVDNGSSDGSSEVMEKFARSDPDIMAVRVEKNIGYGFGIWSGLKKADGEFVCWTHADLQTDLMDTIKAYMIVVKETDPKKSFVKGKRHGRAFMDVFFTFGMSVYETLYLGSWMHDINAQPNLFHRSFLGEVTDPPTDFSFDLYFYYLAKKSGYKITRFPVYFGKRLHGTSNWNTGLGAKWKFIKRTVSYTSDLKRRLRTNGGRGKE